MMGSTIVVGTDSGLWYVGPRGVPPDALAGHPITALVREGTRLWALVGGREIWATHDDGRWSTMAALDGPPATCLVPTANGLLIGTEGAHLYSLTAGRLARIEAFEDVEDRGSWYTPWGEPADVRSVATETDGTIYVNVHVGGVVRSRDGGRSWTPTVDIENDVHEVRAHPTRRGTVAAASGEGLGLSRNGGDSWDFVTEGLHGHYLRAVAFADDVVFVTASTGSRGRRAAIYRKALEDASGFERCRRGLPEWFDGNIDTACLDAQGAIVAFGTEDGRVFRSVDGGASWEVGAKGLPPVRSVIIV
jgi:hypothetical protein